jgi:hypothetical protein
VVVVVPLAPGAPADATEEAAAGIELAGIGETTAVDVASGGAEEAPVAKTPGEPAEDAPAAGVEEVAEGSEPNPDEAGADETAGGLVPTPEDVAAGATLAEGDPGAAAAATLQGGGNFRLVPIVPFT